MDYRVLAAEELRGYRQKCAALRNIRERIKECEESLSSTGASGAAPNRGGGNKTERRWLNLIATIDDEKRRYREMSRAVNRVDRALSVIPEEEAKLLREIFIDGEEIERTAENEHMSRRNLYRKRSEALIHFTRALYGAVIT